MKNYDNAKKEKIHFEVKKIRYRKELTTYTICDVIIKDNNAKKTNKDIKVKTVVVGNFASIFEEDEFLAEGEWVNNDIYGEQFVVHFYEKIYPQTKKGIEEFLRRTVKGIGKKTSELIVAHLGEDTISKIEKDYKCLLDIKGISEKKALKIYDKIVENKKFENVAIFVQSNGLGYKVALRTYEVFKDNAIIKIKENPYCICSIDKIGFFVADTFAKNLQFPFNNPERIKNAIKYFIQWDMQSHGNIFTYRSYILESLNKFLNAKGAYKNENEANISQEEIENALKKLVAENIVVLEKEDDDFCVYLKQYQFIENKIVEYLKQLLEEFKPRICSDSDIEEFIEEYQNEHSIVVAQKQKEAIYMALNNGISILTGGPGTGKTQTINSIIKCIYRVKPNAIINLCAPTGRASKRMTELTGMEAKTIHRLIKLNCSEQETSIEEIQGDFVIIDESSMIDAYVFYKLLQSLIDNPDIRVLFVGDYDQLPSVGPGLILRDLINSCRIPTTKLEEVFRQSAESNIVMNSHRIIKEDTKHLEFNNLKKDDFYFVRENERLKIQTTLLSKIDGLINKKGLKLQDIQVLSPMRVGDLGTVELNRLIQKKFNFNDKNEIELENRNIFRIGDRVIQNINNYDLEVFNGEVGYISDISYHDGYNIVVDFDDSTITYSELYFEELELAYAITVHKSQGSEFPVVLTPIHSSLNKMLNKNILYTAWTRAKRMVVLIGSYENLIKGIEQDANLLRNSRIKEKIIKNIK